MMYVTLYQYKWSVLYNYRLLMRSTHGHEDRVRYWLTDAEGHE